MIWTTLALAAPLDDGSLVQQVTWARPFTLERPHPYRYTSEPRAITRGWLVELQVDPWTQRPGPVVPSLWIGSTIAGRLTWGSGCAVVWVPDDHNLREEPVFFGSTALPEQIDPTEAASIAAQGAKLPRAPRLDVTGPVLELGDFREVAALARTRCATAR